MWPGALTPSILMGGLPGVARSVNFWRNYLTDSVDAAVLSWCKNILVLTTALWWAVQWLHVFLNFSCCFFYHLWECEICAAPWIFTLLVPCNTHGGCLPWGSGKKEIHLLCVQGRRGNHSVMETRVWSHILWQFLQQPRFSLLAQCLGELWTPLAVPASTGHLYSPVFDSVCWHCTDKWGAGCLCSFEVRKWALWKQKGFSGSSAT